MTAGLDASGMNGPAVNDRGSFELTLRKGFNTEGMENHGVLLKSPSRTVGCGQGGGQQ